MFGNSNSQKKQSDVSNKGRYGNTLTNMIGTKKVNEILLENEH